MATEVSAVEANENFTEDNFEAREKAVLEKLETLLQQIRDENIPEQVIKASRYESDGITLREDREDASTIYLKVKQDEISELRAEVEAYTNPDNHFTKQYRTLFGHCGKLQTDLDAIDVSGREELRTLRKKALVEIEELTKILAGKAHESGMVCPDCEVKE